MPDFAPTSIAAKIIESFSDPARGAYAQVATLDARGMPQVRTVHVHYLPTLHLLGFSSHRSTNKWDQIRANGTVSGCWHDAHRGVQIRWESKARLVDNTDSKNEELLTQMWMKMRPEVRETYWLDHNRKPLAGPVEVSFNVNQRPPAHGVVLCEVTSWDIMTIHPKGYRFGDRTIHRREGDHWKSDSISIIKDY